MMECSQRAMGKRKFARERSRENAGDGTFARERTQGNFCEGMFTKGDKEKTFARKCSQRVTFRETVQHTSTCIQVPIDKPDHYNSIATTSSHTPADVTGTIL